MFTMALSLITKNQDSPEYLSTEKNGEIVVRLCIGMPLEVTMNSLELRFSTEKSQKHYVEPKKQVLEKCTELDNVYAVFITC